MTALSIREEIEAAAHRVGHPLADFQIGIGIASGRAVAGKIGTADQVTVTVFGPVVNLAARLEGMTKFIGAPILLDDSTAAELADTLPASVARLRRVARVRPYGMEGPIEVSELLPPAGETSPLTDEHVETFERAASLMFGFESHTIDWGEAAALLSEMPPGDSPKDFLKTFMVQHGGVTPADWDGAISLDNK